MSQRETTVTPFASLSLAGVNQREVAVQLPPSELSQLEGLFPQFVGLQTRNLGKRVLGKYTFPIKSIFQFWTPLGYATGLYQFAGEVDAGTWITPTSNIVIPALPPTLPIDGAGFTIGDLGGGGTLAVPPGNLANVGTPDDTNGGPAGPGTRCRWVETVTSLSFEAYVVSAEWGDTGAVDNVIGTVPPLTVPLSLPDPLAVPYAPWTVPPNPDFASIMQAFQSCGSATDAGLPPGAHNYLRSFGGKVIFNFAALETLEGFRGVFMTLKEQVQTTGLGSAVLNTVPVTSGVPFVFADNFSDEPSIRTTADGHEQVFYTNPNGPGSLFAAFRKRICS